MPPKDKGKRKSREREKETDINEVAIKEYKDQGMNKNDIINALSLKFEPALIRYAWDSLEGRSLKNWVNEELHESDITGGIVNQILDNNPVVRLPENSILDRIFNSIPPVSLTDNASQNQNFNNTPRVRLPDKSGSSSGSQSQPTALNNDNSSRDEREIPSQARQSVHSPLPDINIPYVSQYDTQTYEADATMNRDSTGQSSSISQRLEIGVLSQDVSQPNFPQSAVPVKEPNSSVGNVEK